MKKKFDTKRLIIGCAILVVFLAAANLITGSLPKQPLAEIYDEELVIAEAQRAIEYFNEHDYQSIIDMGDENLKSSVTADDFAKQCDEPMKEWGAFVEYNKIETVGATNEETGEEYGGVLILAKYENSKVQFSIGFNENMELIQFRLQ